MSSRTPAASSPSKRRGGMAQRAVSLCDSTGELRPGTAGCRPALLAHPDLAAAARSTSEAPHPNAPKTTPSIGPNARRPNRPTVTKSCPSLPPKRADAGQSWSNSDRLGQKLAKDGPKLAEFDNRHVAITAKLLLARRFGHSLSSVTTSDCRPIRRKAIWRALFKHVFATPAARRASIY